MRFSWEPKWKWKLLRAAGMKRKGRIWDSVDMWLMGLGNSLFCRATSPHSYPFHTPYPRLCSSELGFPLTRMLSLSSGCLLFSACASLNYSGARSERCYSPTLHRCFPFLVFWALFWSSKPVLWGLRLTILFLSSFSLQWGTSLQTKLLAFSEDTGF